MVAKLPKSSSVAEGDATVTTGPRLVPGAELDSLEMRGAKRAALQQLSHLKSKGVNVGHSVVYVFVGPDLFMCRFDPSPKPPTMASIAIERPKILIQTMNGIVQDTKRAPDLFRGLFAPNWFRQAIKDMSMGFEGCTVWDEGPLPFTLPNGRMYHEPTRLLVTRVYKNMTGGVEEMTFTVTPPPFPGETSSDPVSLVRKVDPTKEPGGIVRIALIIGVDKRVVWPKIGDYNKTSTMAAGEKAVLEYAKGLYDKGVIDRCGIRVYMGTDESAFKLIGDPKTSNPTETRLPHPSEMEGIAAAPRIPQQPLEDRGLATDFNLSISIQPQHELWNSESQFQAIKQYMAEKAKTKTPEELYKQAMVTMPLAAKRYLEGVFPGCEISVEGAFPSVLPDEVETAYGEAILAVARDPKQEPTSVVAVINVIPCPSGDGSDLYSDKVWIDTPEMKAADDRLLELLKRWHVEGKVSKVDCMAQTMMAKDVTVYQFVDGERFEDYSDERMQQLNWG
ncbi:hypothetical protein ACHAPU_008216 [Fusarium lateritium]